MISLTATLLAHQKLPSRKPSILLTAKAQQGETPLLRFTRYYTGAEADSPHACAVPPSGALIRARNDGGIMYTSKVTTPGPGSTYSAWTSLGAVATSGTGIALAARTGEALLLYLNGNSVKYRTSSDDGASWSAESNLITEASAPTWIALAYRPNGDACAFYNLAGTVRRIRRTAGAWAGSSTAWTNTLSTVSGIAVDHDGADFHLCLTGTPASGRNTAYGCLMGDGGFPANTWSALSEIVSTDPASTASYVRPSLLWPATEALAWFTLQETATPTYNRVLFSRAMAFNGANSSWWLEPQPHEAQSNYGLSVATGDNLSAWAITASGVWYAPINSQADLSARLLSAIVHFGPASTSATITLDNTDSLLNTPHPALFPGSTIVLNPGYLSNAGAAEYGVTWRLNVDSLQNEIQSDGRRILTARCSGPWERLASWRAPQSWQIAQGAQARADTFQRITSRPGVSTFQSSPSSDFTAGTPAFALQPGETAQGALERLLAVVSDHARHEDGALTVRDVQPSDPSTQTYGGPNNHPVFNATRLWGPPPADWVRVQGPDRYADAFTPAAVYQHGNRHRQLRNLDMTTDAKVTAAASAALRRTIIATPIAQVTVPFHAGQQLYDIITLNEERLGLSALTARVIALTLEYQRGPLPRPRYNLTLQLSEV